MTVRELYIFKLNLKYIKFIYFNRDCEWWTCMRAWCLYLMIMAHSRHFLFFLPVIFRKINRRISSWVPENLHDSYSLFLNKAAFTFFKFGHRKFK